MRFLGFAAVAMTASLLSATFAQAKLVSVPYSVTYTAVGTIVSGSDALNLFGGGNLAGLSYIDSYTLFDTPYNCCITTVVGPFGTVTSLDSPIATALISTNGRSFDVSGSGSSGNGAFELANFDNRAVEVTGESCNLSVNLSDSVDRSPSEWAGIVGATDIFQDDSVSGSTGSFVASEFYASNGTAVTYELFDVSSISTTYNTIQIDLPEPATWAIMLMGIGLIGTVARLRGTSMKRESWA